MDFLTEPRLEEIFRYVFKLPPEVDVSGVAQEDVPDWDSLAHVSLILALESEFNIAIEPADTMDLTSYESVARYLQERGA